MTFTAVVTAHNQNIDSILKELQEQTRRPDEVLVYWSGECMYEGHKMIWEDRADSFKGFYLRIIKQPNQNDWGHEKRDLGLRAATGEFIGFFNADDSYSERYIEMMMKEAEVPSVGFVFCWWKPMGRCTPTYGSSTSGNFIVRQDIAREAGYWKDRHYEADGTFIEAVVKATKELDSRVIEVPEILYHHNAR